jgi:RNA polymerase sigma-70 factor (ECF subfamily)
LDRLCRAYWYPLYAYARRKGHSPEDAQDLTQGFLARLLASHRIALADPARGRFRTFLLSAMQNFLINEWAKASTEKRGGGMEFLPLHTEDPEHLYTAEPADQRTPETIYKQRWAATVMALLPASSRSN